MKNKKLEDIKIDDIHTKVRITGTVNTRHIGGYEGRDGRLTDDLAFIRSDVPFNITEEDIRFLVDRGIETVIDLRTQDEIEGSPVPFGEMAEISYIVIPLVSDETPPHLMMESDLGDLYIHILEDRKMQLAEVMRMIARTQGGVFYNCSAGKDRTGIISMLLLLLAGVDKETVIQDYYYTAILIEPWIKEVVPKLEAEGVEFNMKMLEALPQYMRRAIDHLEEKYGSAEIYAKSLGLSEKEVQKIIDKTLK